MLTLETIEAYAFYPKKPSDPAPQPEFAARGGNKTQEYKYAGSNDIDEVAWYGEDYYTGSYHEVAQKKPNELGLYDMTGNIWEKCYDGNRTYTNSSQTDPVGPLDSGYIAVRGGGYNATGKTARITYREYNMTKKSDSFFLQGFRLALGAPIATE